MAKKKAAVKKSPVSRSSKPMTKARSKARSAPKRSAAPATRARRVSAKHATDSLNWVHDFTLKMLADVPADKLTAQAAGATNHALWTLGHLATGYAWFGPFIGSAPIQLPESYNKLFGSGSSPVDNPSAYPPIHEVRRHHDAAYKSIADALAKITDDDLQSPPVGDSGGFVSNKLDGIIKTAWHEGWHQGQLSALRRVLGLKAMMG